MSELFDTFESGAKDAIDQGMEVVGSDEYVLLLDFDDRQPECYDRVMESIKQNFGIRYEQIWPSKSGWPHHHRRIVLNTPLPPLARMVLAAALGSDPIREVISVKRHCIQGVENPIRLFRPLNMVPLLPSGPPNDGDSFEPF